MTKEEVIQGLQFTIEMFLFDPSTGETLTEPRNNLDKATIDACKGAIEKLEQTKWIPVSEGLPKEQIKIGKYVFSENVLGTEGYTIRKAYYNYTTKQWFDGNDEIEWTEITHWMSLPEELPKAESGDEDEEVQDDGI